MKRVLAAPGILLGVLLAFFVLFNLNSLDDGIAYLQDMAAYAPKPSQPLDARGRFGICEQFVTLRNAQRAQFIANYLDARGIAYERLPIYDSGFDNFWIPFAAQGTGTTPVAYTIFSAHYDKFFNDPAYHGAQDNSAAVCMLLVAAEELSKQRPARPAAILLTGEEERGLVGAKAFYEYATQNDVRVESVLNFDSIGRDGLAARASGARSGFVFTIPPVGEFVYDGREFAPASSYRQPDARRVEQMQRFAPVVLFDRMVASSDGTYFQDRGWDAVNLTSDNIYYLDQTWHTYADRIEQVEQTNLERALQLVLGFARQEQ